VKRPAERLSRQQRDILAALLRYVAAAEARGHLTGRFPGTAASP
jgi:hypothetical protein